MIPVLYPSTETAFVNNGLGGLPDAINCIVTEQRNTQGGYYLEMDYPIDGLHYADIAPERIIYAAPFMGATPQPFRISRINRPINGIVHIEAPHISAELQKLTSWGIDTGTNIQGMIYNQFYRARQLGQTVPFWCETDITAESDVTFSHPEPTTLADILLGAEGSVLDVVGGEYEWDGYHIILHSQRGTDSGLEIRYGVNMSDIEAETDAAELVTAVVPFWKGTVNDADVVVMGDMCEADNADAYAYVRCVPLDVSEQFELEQDQQPTAAQVTAKGTAFINGTGRKLLQMSIRVKYEPTTNCIGERLINLCDTVRVVYPDLGVSSISKVVETRFNVLTEQYDELTIGSIRNNIVDTIAGLISGGAITGGGGSSGGGGSTAVTSVNGKTGAVVLNATDVGAMPSTYTAPVTSVNGMTGDVVVSGGGSVANTVLYTEQSLTDAQKEQARSNIGSGKTTVSVENDMLTIVDEPTGAIAAYSIGGGAVDSVNGQTGVVVLDAEDVGALPDNTSIPSKTSELTNDSGFITLSDVPAQSVTSVNGKTGVVVLDADDVGALPDDTVIPAKTSDLINDSGFITDSDVPDYKSDWNETDFTKSSYILNKPTIPTKTSDLTNDSLVRTVNGKTDRSIELKMSDIPNDAGYITDADLPAMQTAVLYGRAQSLTDVQKQTARKNVGEFGYSAPLQYKPSVYQILDPSKTSSSQITSGVEVVNKYYRDDECNVYLTDENGNRWDLKSVTSETNTVIWHRVDGNTEYMVSLSGTGTTATPSQASIGGGGGSAANAVLYTAQTLSDAQKLQARTNIGADMYTVTVADNGEQASPRYTLASGVTPALIVAHIDNLRLLLGHYYRLFTRSGSGNVWTLIFGGIEVNSVGGLDAVTFTLNMTLSPSTCTIAKRSTTVSGSESSAATADLTYTYNSTTNKVVSDLVGSVVTGDNIMAAYSQYGGSPVVMHHGDYYHLHSASSAAVEFRRLDNTRRIIVDRWSSTASESAV